MYAIINTQSHIRINLLVHIKNESSLVVQQSRLPLDF